MIVPPASHPFPRKAVFGRLFLFCPPVYPAGAGHMSERSAALSRSGGAHNSQGRRRPADRRVFMTDDHKGKLQGETGVVSRLHRRTARRKKGR